MKGIVTGVIVTALLVGGGVASGLINVGTRTDGKAASIDLATLFDKAPARAPAPVKASAKLTGIVMPSGLMIPVIGVQAAQLGDTWGQSRDSGARAHQAIDIPAPLGTPVVAAMSGVVERLFTSERGGLTVYIRSPDRAWESYYAHLSGYAAGLSEGQVVPRGMVIGYVGETGNVAPGSPHLHFALARMAAGDSWSQGQPINPYPLLVGAGGGG